jgi:hypothetical protein
LAAAPGSVEERMTSLFRRCLTRPPTVEERTALVEFFTRQRDRLQQGTLDAKAIAGSDASDMVQRAAWALAARAVLNLDEMITKE